MKRLAAHQPNFAPWSGFFAKARAVDVFVLLPDAKFSRNSFGNRVKIAAPYSAPKSWQWWTVPVTFAEGATYREVRFAQTWARDRRKLAKTFEQVYGDTYQGPAVVRAVRGALADAATPVDLNRQLIAHAWPWLDAQAIVARPPHRSVFLDRRPPANATERLIEVCRWWGCDRYLTGVGGLSYLDLERFEEVGIAVDVLRPNASVSVLSVLDVICRNGAHSGKIVDAMFDVEPLS